MPALPCLAQTESRRLLRVLFLRHHQMPAETNWRILLLNAKRGAFQMLSKNAKRILIILPLLVLATGLFYWSNPNLADFSSPRNTTVQLTDLQQFELLRRTFESDSGYVRLIAQLSPT